jgi:N-acetylneuraminic acid mutarotase
MIVWGGSANAEFNSGGRYNPATDSWSPTSTAGAPEARASHTAVWTGIEMIVWGGVTGGGFSFLNSGGRYNPATDSWRPTGTVNSPGPRYAHAAVWTGAMMVTFGGCLNHDCSSRTNTGGRYDPVADAWAPTTLNNAPSARNSITAVWTGAEMLVWGGCVSGECEILTNTGGRYNPVADSWTATAAPPVQFPRTEWVSVWTGSEMLIWGIDSQLLDTFVYRYSPATDSWSRAAGLNAPGARSGFSGVWTGTELIVWGGSVTGFGPQVTGGRFNPATGLWVDTAIADAPSARVNHSAVWTGGEMVVWGGCIDEGCAMPVNTGARYSPASDTWTGMALTGAPAARFLHTALWTGAEMLIWGGHDGAGATDTGARYSPASDSWRPVSTSGAPAGRWAHGDVWTGTEMLVWGGYNGSMAFGDGARYRPASDTWMPISFSGAPAARWNFPSVWTGSEFIVWGGILNAEWPFIATNTGARYNPALDSWTTTTLQSAPAARDLQQAVWTGSHMLVWSGRLDPNGSYTNTGGAYAATSAGGGPGALPTVASLLLNPALVIAGGVSQGTVTLSSGAPVGGAVIALSASNQAAGVPASVAVAEGAVSAVFAVAANPVTAVTSVTITAAFNGSSGSALLSVSPPASPTVPVVSSLSLNSATLKGGSWTVGTVVLSKAAPAGGTLVALASSEPAIAMVPATVTVPAGAVSAKFVVSTRRVARTRNVVISAAFGGSAKQTTLQIVK